MKKLIILLAVIFINCGNVNAEPNALLEGEVLAHFVEEGYNNKGGEYHLRDGMIITRYQGKIYQCKVYFAYKDYKCTPLEYKN